MQRSNTRRPIAGFGRNANISKLPRRDRLRREIHDASGIVDEGVSVGAGSGSGEENGNAKEGMSG